MQGGVPVPEAANTLGISEKTVRRRIKDGTLDAYEIHTANGPSWRVVLPVVHGRQGAGSGEADDVSTALSTLDIRLDKRDRVIGAFLMEMAQMIEALEAERPEYGPHDPGSPVVLRREEYPTDATRAVADATPAVASATNVVAPIEDTPSRVGESDAVQGRWARFKAWLGGGG